MSRHFTTLCFRPLPENYSSVITDTLAKLLQCDIERVDKRALSGWVLLYGEKIQPYRDCIRQTRKGHQRHCEHVLSAICRNSSLVAAKTIRTPLYVVQKLLESLPGLKVVYYTRDPRGIICSRAGNIRRIRDNDIIAKIKVLCDVMGADYKYSTSLASRYPDRFKQVQYEQLAMEPKKTAEELYRFSGHSLPDTVSNWIANNTVQHKKGQLSTTRISRETAYRWRKEFTPSLQQKLTQSCRETLKLLGYPE